MALNTFTSGVNTSFSSQLNTNFTEVAKSFRYNPVRQYLTYQNSSTYTNPVYIDNLYSPSTLVVVAIGSNDVYKSTNGGATFVQKTTITSPQYLGCAHENSSYLIVWSSSVCKYSTDAGENWSSLSSFPTSVTHYKLHITNSGRIYCLGKKSGTNLIDISYTDDGGSSWTSIRTGTNVFTTSNNISALAVGHDGFISYAVADDGSIDEAETGYTSNNGSSWTTQTDTTGAIGSGVGAHALYYDANNYVLSNYYVDNNVYFNTTTGLIRGSTADAELKDEGTTSTGSKFLAYLCMVDNFALFEHIYRNSVPQFIETTKLYVDGLIIENVMQAPVVGQVSNYSSIFAGDGRACYRTANGKPVFVGYTIYDPYDVI